MKLLLILLSGLCLRAQVSVAITSPQPGEQIGQIYQGPFSSQLGTVSSTAGSITSVTINVDGTPCAGSCVINLGAGTFGGNIYAKDLTAGSHTFTAIATDSMGNMATSAGVVATVVHSNPVCSHSLVGGNIYAEVCGTNSVNADIVTITNTRNTAGDKIFATASAGTSAVRQGYLTASVSSGVTTWTVADESCIGGGGCTWPSTPFDGEFSDPASAEKATVLTSSLSAGVWTFTGIRGVAGQDCVIAGPSYHDGGQNVTVPSTCSAAAAHTTATIFNVWPSRFLPITAISDTFGYTWHSILRETSGPIGDGANSPGAIWYADVPTTTAGTDTITITAPGIAAFISDLVVYSGLAPGGPRASPGLRSGFGGVQGFGNATSGDFTSVPGDLNLGFIGGAPVIPITGQTLRLQAGSRPLLFIQDQYSTSTTANMQALMNPEGFGAWGYAFPPLPSAYSIILSSQSVFNSSIPACTTQCRIELSIDQLDTGFANHTRVIADSNALGIQWELQNNSGVLTAVAFFPGGSGCTSTAGGFSILNFAGSSYLDLRLQIDYTAKTLTQEGWDITGNHLAAATITCTSTGTTTNGIQLTGGGAGHTFNNAYLRMYSTLLSYNSTPVTTAQSQVGCIFQWKFENDLIDYCSPGTYPATLSSGSAAYTGTVGTDLIKALINTTDSTYYSPWITQRVGGTGQLDGSRSYTRDPSSATVTYSWLQLTTSPAAPSTLTFPDGTTVSKPHFTNMTGLGTYTVQLTASAASGSFVSATLAFGAANMDAKGVIIQGDAANKVFGPMIAFGYSGWLLMDELACTSTHLQIDGTDCLGNQIQPSGNPYYNSALSWLTPATGTISYPFGGIGTPPGQGCIGSHVSGGTQATLNGSTTATATTIAINNAQCLSLATLPTWLMIGTNAGGLTGTCTNPLTCGVELIRVVATTSTTGSATLTVSTNASGTAASVDGRGLAGVIYNNNQPMVPAQAWPSGTLVGEMRVQGTSTQFISDSQRPLCPAGMGPTGQIIYSTGQVSGTAGGTVLTGHSTAWTQNVYSGGMLVSSGLFNTDQSHNLQSQVYARIAGNHNSGTPFVFWSFVSSVAADNSTITISRPLPADFDSGNFSYQIISAVFWSLEFVAPNGSTQRAIQQGAGCESETAAFAVASHDIPALNLTQQTGLKISYKTELNAQSPFGPNFYGQGLAFRAFYQRSGYVPALTAANHIDDNWPRDPEIGGGYLGGLILNQGGGVIGGIVDKILNPSTPLDWLDLTQFANAGIAFASHNCNTDDPRDNGYPHAWLALHGLFDLDVTRQISYTSGLLSWVASDAVCRRNASDGYAANWMINGTPDVKTNSWAGSSLFSTQGPVLTLTNNSTAVTGTGFSSGMCAGIDDGTGTLTVVPGGTDATVVTGTVNAGNNIVITDTTGAQIAIVFEFSGSGSTGSVIHLGGQWPGTGTGPYHFMVEGNNLTGYMTSIGTSNADWPDVSVAVGAANNQMLQKFWACKYNNTTSITLSSPWDGVTSDVSHVYHSYSYVVTGFEVQPFMLSGPKAAALNWASLNPNPAISVPNNTYKAQLASWVSSYGLDTTTPNKGMFYDRNSGKCEPAGIPNAVTLFDTIHGPGSQNSCGSMGLAGTLGGGVGEFASRVNTGEGSIGVNQIYLTNPNSTTKSIVSTAYGTLWGDCSKTLPGFYCDAHFVTGETSNGALGAYKWPGFFYGMGMAHQLPAILLQNSQSSSQNKSAKQNDSAKSN